MKSCRHTQRRLIWSEGTDPGGAASAHLVECVACQAEGVRIRKYHRTLRGWAATDVPAPPGFCSRVLGAVDDVRPYRSRRPPDWVAATGALVAVAGAVAIVGRRRLRGVAA